MAKVLSDITRISVPLKISIKRSRSIILRYGLVGDSEKKRRVLGFMAFLIAS